MKFQGTYILATRKIWKLLPKELKNGFIRMQFLIIFTSFIDLFGLVLFIPLLSAVADAEILNNNTLFVYLKSAFGIQNNSTFLMYLFFFAFVFFVFRSVFILGSNWIQNRYIFKIKEYVAKKTYNYYLQSEYEEFCKKEADNVVLSLTSWAQYYAVFLVRPLLLINSELVVMTLVVLSIAFFNFKVFLLLMITILPVAYLFNKAAKRKMEKLGKIQNELTPILYNRSSRGVYGYIDVKLRQKENLLINEYFDVLQELNQASIKSNVMSIVPAKLFEVVTVGGLIVIYWYGVFISKSPEIILPLITVYAAAGYRLIPSLNKIIPSLSVLQQYSFVHAIYEEPLAWDGGSSSEKIETNITFNEVIIFDHIQFRFEGARTKLFHDLNLEIHKGEIIGLIGKSGAGKTTLAQLLAGLMVPTKGIIRVDRSELNANSRRAWMKKISYVQQEPYIESGSLTKNIAFLEEDVDYIRLEQSIEKASLMDLLGDQNPDKFQIKERGTNLSGGQKQRIIIARALYHKAEMIILDEATSALDNETEEEINQTLANLKTDGVTVIIIAHRYSTLKHADRILQMENGKISKEVNFEDLVQ